MAKRVNLNAALMCLSLTASLSLFIAAQLLLLNYMNDCCLTSSPCNEFTQWLNGFPFDDATVNGKLSQVVVNDK